MSTTDNTIGLSDPLLDAALNTLSESHVDDLIMQMPPNESETEKEEVSVLTPEFDTEGEGIDVLSSSDDFFVEPGSANNEPDLLSDDPLVAPLPELEDGLTSEIPDSSSYSDVGDALNSFFLENDIESETSQPDNEAKTDDVMSGDDILKDDAFVLSEQNFEYGDNLLDELPSVQTLSQEDADALPVTTEDDEDPEEDDVSEEDDADLSDTNFDDFTDFDDQLPVIEIQASDDADVEPDGINVVDAIHQLPSMEELFPPINHQSESLHEHSMPQDEHVDLDSLPVVLIAPSNEALKNPNANERDHKKFAELPSDLFSSDVIAPSDADEYAESLAMRTPLLSTELNSEQIDSTALLSKQGPSLGEMSAVDDANLEPERTSPQKTPENSVKPGNHKYSTGLISFIVFSFVVIAGLGYWSYIQIQDLKNIVQLQQKKYNELDSEFNTLNKLLHDESGKTIVDVLREVDGSLNKQKSEYSALIDANARSANQFQEDVISRLEKVVQYSMNNAESQKQETTALRSRIDMYEQIVEQLKTMDKKDPRVEQLLTKFEDMSSQLKSVQNVVRSQTELTGLLESEQALMKSTLEKVSSKSSNVPTTGRTQNVSVQSSSTPAQTPQNYSSELDKLVLLGVFVDEETNSYSLIIQDIANLNTSVSDTYTYKPGVKSIIPGYGQILDVQFVEGSDDAVKYIVVTEKGVIKGISQQSPR